MTRMSILAMMGAPAMRWRYWWLAVAAVGLVLIGVGLAAGQWQVVRRWANVLCTGCIGLTLE